MKILKTLLAVCLITSFSGGVHSAEENLGLADYKYNGITYMSMQADNGSWMDTVWALEVEDVTSNLFDLIVSPTPKRISVKVLTEFDSAEWIAIWNRKLQAVDINNGLAQAEYTKSFAVVTDYLPEVLSENDQFSIESVGETGLTISFNGEKIVTIKSDHTLSFWMSAWISAPNAGIYADGSMLAQGDIDTYLIDLQEGVIPALDPSLVSAAF